MTVEAFSIYTLKESRTFPGLAEECAAARSWTRALVAPFHDVIEAVELVVSEFFSNALAHTASGQAGGEVFVSLVGLVYGTLHLEVVDQGPRTDRPRTAARVMLPDPGRPGGCGLFLTAALAREWGRTPADGSYGIFDRSPDDYTGPMVTWADFTTSAAPPRG
ncbi:ATP-binding protein [Actinorugispora endophytica]|uniref:Anti-sigma regulatory factor (Ser/Thr protein kinase) n=1 Tax=Actinorugispora endophytica TaxID=1605990 RepID=A0A4R6V0Q3_9ACTN|nr:ATP-binding protein [Actinorugispora endophytica]TDQ52195.1 anti-sigma regulatory factor (Ser/Thr protein kinase) [Actinorugispora endophytica]